jgi:glutamine cyclotransferase
VGRIDLTPKADEIKLLNADADVLNGIAWHPATKSLIVTGKHWPLIYILQLKN